MGLNFQHVANHSILIFNLITDFFHIRSMTITGAYGGGERGAGQKALTAPLDWLQPVKSFLSEPSTVVDRSCVLCVSVSRPRFSSCFYLRTDQTAFLFTIISSFKILEKTKIILIFRVNNIIILEYITMYRSNKIFIREIFSIIT